MVSRQYNCCHSKIQTYSDEVKYWYRRLDCVCLYTKHINMYSKMVHF